jgi:hypothetical protein
MPDISSSEEQSMYRQATYLVITVFLCISTLSIAGNPLEIRMSINDTFRIEANPIGKLM